MNNLNIKKKQIRGSGEKNVDSDRARHSGNFITILL